MYYHTENYQTILTSTLLKQRSGLSDIRWQSKRPLNNDVWLQRKKSTKIPLFWNIYMWEEYAVNQITIIIGCWSKFTNNVQSIKSLFEKKREILLQNVHLYHWLNGNKKPFFFFLSFIFGLCPTHFKKKSNEVFKAKKLINLMIFSS